MAADRSRRRSRSSRRARGRSALSPRLWIGRRPCCRARTPIMMSEWGPRYEVCDAADLLRRTVRDVAS
eukprot:6990185-Alexandrium_andersonii.AAC.1